MKKENNQLKSQLDRELEQIQFSKQQEVIKRAFPNTWKQKMHNLWNKELAIPLFPISAVLVLIIAGISYKEISPIIETNNHQRIAVNVAGSGYYYLEEDLERVLVSDEN